LFAANLAQSYPKEVATHLALSALLVVQDKDPNALITAGRLQEVVQSMTGPGVWEEEEPQMALESAVGEVYASFHFLLHPIPLTMFLFEGLVRRMLISLTRPHSWEV